ncbi:MAG: hypothetical protein WBW88_06745 [Rhodothermales bacterium]
MKLIVSAIVAEIVCFALLPGIALGQQPFKFQGALELDGTAVNDTCAFRFILWDDSTSGSIVGPISFVDLPVAEGVFETTLDFGNVFDGSPYWLGISVTYSGGDCSSGPYQELLPRTPLATVPYAYGLKGPAYVRANDAEPALRVRNSGSGDGVRVDSAGGYGVFARGASGTAGYFAGDVVAEGHFRYPSARTYAYQVPVAAFMPTGYSETNGIDLSPFWNEVSGYIEVFDSPGTSESLAFSAEVNLPDSVTITAVKLHYYDDDATNDIEFIYSFLRRPVSGTANEGIVVGALVNSSGSSSSVQNDSGFISGNALVENASYMYWLTVSIIQPVGSSWSPDLRFYGMTIEYHTNTLSN